MRAMKRNAARHSPSTGRRRLPDGVGGAGGKGAAQDAGVSNISRSKSDRRAPQHAALASHFSLALPIRLDLT
jgi:hypothetical protein